MTAPLKLTRAQILAFRRRVGLLEERAPRSDESLRRAAWAGLQDSMPRAALLSLHARLHGVEHDTWDDPSLIQLWGPRYQVYVVPKQDFALFSLARLPDDEKGRLRAEQMAEMLRKHLGRSKQADRDVHAALRTGNSVRYAATTGTLAIRWAGARAPIIWCVPRPTISPAEARRGLARRYLQVYGPSTAERFARWAGISRRSGAETFASLERELLPVRSPLGEELLLAEDEAEMRADAAAPAAARLLPSGDAYYLLDGAERALLLPEESRRLRLWTSRVWPGALLVDGEVWGTWRRAQHVVRVETFAPLPRAARDAVEAEAAALPLPALERAVQVIWE